MKASNIKFLNGSGIRVISGVICDTLLTEVPEGIEWIGFKFEMEPNSTEIKEDLIDSLVAISNQKTVRGHGVEVVLELDYKESWSEEDVVFWAASGEFNIALCGLSLDSKEEDQDLYVKRYKSLNELILKTNNFKKYSFPMMLDMEIEVAKSLGAENLEVLERKYYGLVDLRSPKESRVEYAIKATPIGLKKIRNASIDIIEKSFGSIENFGLIMRSISLPIADRVKTISDVKNEQPKTKQERFNL